MGITRHVCPKNTLLKYDCLWRTAIPPVASAQYEEDECKFELDESVDKGLGAFPD